MYYLAKFQRTSGAKDKQKRKSNLIRNVAIGAGVVTTLGIGGKVLLKSKNKNGEVLNNISSKQAKRNTETFYEDKNPIVVNSNNITVRPRRFKKSTPVDVARRKQAIQQEMNDWLKKKEITTVNSAKFQPLTGKNLPDRPERYLNETFLSEMDKKGAYRQKSNIDPYDENSRKNSTDKTKKNFRKFTIQYAKNRLGADYSANTNNAEFIGLGGIKSGLMSIGKGLTKQRSLPKLGMKPRLPTMNKLPSVAPLAKANISTGIKQSYKPGKSFNVYSRPQLNSLKNGLTNVSQRKNYGIV